MEDMMLQNKLNENLEKMQGNSVKASQVLGKAMSEGAKKLAVAHTAMANSLASRAKEHSADLLTMKSPNDFSKYMQAEVNQDLLQDLIAYQEELMEIYNNYSHEMYLAYGEVYEAGKESLDEWFDVVCANAPNGTDYLIRPYQTSMKVCTQWGEQIGGLSKNIATSMEENVRDSFKNLNKTYISEKKQVKKTRSVS